MASLKILNSAIILKIFTNVLLYICIKFMRISFVFLRVKRIFFNDIVDVVAHTVHVQTQKFSMYSKTLKI